MRALGPRTSRLARCGLGLAIGLVAAGASMGLNQLVVSPFLLMYPAVVLAAWLAGWDAAVMVLLVAVFAIWYFVLPPAASLHIHATRDAVELGLFCALSSLLIALVVRMKRALQDAEAARRARDTMVAVVAHDLRNPLETIGLNAELLSRDIGSADVRRRLRRIARAAEQAHRLVEGNLDTARGGDLFPLHRDHYPLAQLVDDVVGSFDLLADRATIRVDQQSSDGLAGTLFCDHDRITQALTNIVANAVAFTPRGGVISIRVRRESNGVRLEVEDAGPGMTDEERARMFEERWTRRPGVGSGLGLWVTKAIIDAHGGRISVKSAPGAGTTVSVLLPQPAVAAEPAIVAAPAHA